MSKLTGTVKVKEEAGSRMVFLVESWTKPGLAHRVDLIARDGFGLCSCAQSQIRVHVAIKEGADWHDPKASCRHVLAARRFFLKKLLTHMSKGEGA